MLLNILTWPDARLLDIAAEVSTIDVTFITNLFETMYDAGGIGLAATQVGVAQRAVVIDCGPRVGDDEHPPRPFALINAQIVERSGTIIWREGCLSLPGVTAEVERSEVIVVDFLDVQGCPQRQRFEGLEAVCVQHELDHLDGLLYVDRLGLLERRATLLEYDDLSQEEQAQVIG